MKPYPSVFFFFIVMLSFSQQVDFVDFKKAKVLYVFNQIETNNSIYNSYSIQFNILKNTDSIYLDAVNMTFKNVALNGVSTSYKNDKNKLIIYNNFKASNTYNLDFIFFTSPKKAMYSVGWDNDAPNQVWTQGQGKYTSNWLPSIDDMNDKIEFDMSYVAPKNYEVIANGKLISKRESPSYNLWEYDMQQPMSSYLVAVVLGKYHKKVAYSKSGIPLEMYYYPEDSLKFEPTYRYTKQMFDFFEEAIGVPYPWQNYKQVPVHDFLYAGMENTSLTIFADTYVTDSIGFVDKNYVNVNAHELAHQWFGDLVTETSGTHHWLHEGFATYYALLAEKEIFGNDYYYWRLYEYAQQLLEQDKAGGSTSLLDPKSSSLTFYQKGALVLHILREQIGDKAFKKAVKQYLVKHKYQNVETDNFLFEVEKASGQDLRQFKEKWLQSNTIDKEFIYQSLSKNETILFLITQEENPYLTYRKDDDNELIPSSLTMQLPEGYYPLKNAVIKELLNKPEYPTYNDLLSEAFQSKNIKVRQAIAQNLTKIPLEFKADYESFLNDKSYQTIESALYNLWINFPEDRQKYLEKTKSIIGFADKNVRLLWLTLHLVTPNFQAENKQEIYNELVHYTSENYGFEIRLKAFTYLNSLNACNDICKSNLKQAATHHNWRLQKFAKQLLNENP